MSDLDNQVELGVLKSVVSKLDSSIEKIAQLNGDITKLLAVHETRLDSLERVSENRTEDIKELHSRITTQIDQVAKKIDEMEIRLEERMRNQSHSATEQHNRIQREIEEDIEKLGSRISKLEQWKWWVMGIALAFGYFIGHLPELFLTK